MNLDGNMLRRLYSARAAIAYAISLDGPGYAPILDRIEQEIAACHNRIDVVSRARLILDEPDVGRFAVRFAQQQTGKDYQ